MNAVLQWENCHVWSHWCNGWSSFTKHLVFWLHPSSHYVWAHSNLPACVQYLTCKTDWLIFCLNRLIDRCSSNPVTLVFAAEQPEAAGSPGHLGEQVHLNSHLCSENERPAAAGPEQQQSERPAAGHGQVTDDITSIWLLWMGLFYINPLIN